MRTTLVIPDITYQKVREAARREQCTISQFMTEALELRLARMAGAVAEERAPYRVKSVSMGEPSVDVSNREALYRAMEEE